MQFAHNHPANDIAACLMIRNENRYIAHSDGSHPKPQYTMIEQVLRRLKSLVSEVYVVDNGSADGTLQQYADLLHGLVKKNDPTLPFDDIRDRRWLVETAQQMGKKWLLWVDGDEIFEDAADSYIHNLIAAQRDNVVYPNVVVDFEYINLWRGRTQYRTDAWSGIRFKRLMTTANLRISGAALHNCHFDYAGGFELAIHAPVKVLHYGWADWEHRVAKTARYIQRDMEVYGRTYEEASKIYAADLDETGLTLADAKPEWASEFRTGRIDY